MHCEAKKREMEDEFDRIDKENSWGALFQYIRNKAKEHALPHKEARRSCNARLNRYKDVYPYDHSRICLQRADTNYINASLVPVPDANRSYILTQGPLPMTTSHFWTMVWEQKSKAIVMLNRIVEKNIIKCHKYWPSEDDDELILEDVNLKVSNQGEEISTNFLIRHLMLTDLKTCESRLIYHFHYVTWPDFGVPETPEQFLHFLEIVREKGVLDDVAAPCIIHCSAGIGRSGTFCLVDSSLVMIKELKSLDISGIKELLLEMRRYRMGLIQTSDQLRFSCLAIIEGVKNILKEYEQPSLLQKEEEIVLQDELSSESSPEDNGSESSEKTSEESASSSDATLGASEEELEQIAAPAYSTKVSKDEEMKSESSNESENHLHDSSNVAETESNHNRNSPDSTKPDKVHSCDTVQEYLIHSACETSSDQASCKEASKFAADDLIHPQEISDLSQKCTVHAVNDITDEIREVVKTAERPNEMETANETSKGNKNSIANSIHFEIKQNPVTDVPANDAAEPNDYLLSISEHSDNCKLPSSATPETNIHKSCGSGKQCSVSNIHSLGKLSSSCLDMLSNDDDVANEYDISTGIMSRHLEFYQNGGVYLTKEHKNNLSENKSHFQKDQKTFCANSKYTRKPTFQSSYRSLSCPRQLPSISSKLKNSRTDGDARKRRNSTESGHLPDDDISPLKFQKMNKDHRNAESQIMEELALLEETYDTDCQDRSKESLLRSKR